MKTDVEIIQAARLAAQDFKAAGGTLDTAQTAVYNAAQAFFGDEIWMTHPPDGVLLFRQNFATELMKSDA